MKKSQKTKALPSLWKMQFWKNHRVENQIDSQSLLRVKKLYKNQLQQTL